MWLTCACAGTSFTAMLDFLPMRFRRNPTLCGGPTNCRKLLWSVRNSHVVLACPEAQKGRRADTRELTEVPDEVWLVEVAVRERNVDPVDWEIVDLVDGASKARQPREYLRCQANVIAKRVDEPVGAHADFSRDLTDRMSSRRTLQSSDRVEDRGIRRAARVDTSREECFEQQKPLLMRLRLADALAQFSGLARPEERKRHLGITELTRW